MEVIDGLLIILGLGVAAWWIVARNHFPRALSVLWLAALGVAAVTLLVEGAHCQLAPWQLLAAFGAVAAALKWWRPAISRRSTRMLGRVVLLLTIAAGAVGFLFARVPSRCRRRPGRTRSPVRSFAGPTVSVPKP